MSWLDNILAPTQNISQDANGNVRINQLGTVGVGYGANPSFTGSAAGDSVYSNANKLRWTLSTQTAAELVGLDTSDRLTLGAGVTQIKLGYASQASGGGATSPTFAVGIGQSGQPTTAAQNGWYKFTDSAGAVFWVPIWR